MMIRTLQENSIPEAVSQAEIDADRRMHIS